VSIRDFFSKLNGFYLDDVVIYSRTWKEILFHLNDVLKSLNAITDHQPEEILTDTNCKLPYPNLSVHPSSMPLYPLCRVIIEECWIRISQAEGGYVIG